jgi:chorismate--pyruvate lyase
LSKQTSVGSGLEPRWISLARRRPVGVPDRFYRWIRDHSSLTGRVVEHCQGRFRVRVLHQGWGDALLSERRLLKMRRSELVLLREVELLCDEVPWVFARTVIPARSLSGSARKLAQLGDRPLGAALFSVPTTRRLRVEMALLQPRHPLFAAAADHLDPEVRELWGRRTLFLYAGKPLVVNEIFLPAIPPLRPASGAPRR